MKVQRDQNQNLVIPKGFRLLRGNEYIEKTDKVLTDTGIKEGTEENWIVTPAWLVGRTPHEFSVIRVD